MHLKLLPLLLFLLAGYRPASAQSFSWQLSNENAMLNTFNLPNLTQAGTQAPYWQIFWVFGDGNYYWRQGPMYPPASTPQPTGHTYPPLGLSYNPVSLLIDRKTDPPPPGVASFFPNPLTAFSPSNTLGIVPATPLQPGYDPIVYSSMSPPLIEMSKNRCARIKLANSHFVQDKRWTGFIQAFKPINRDSRLLFFFDDTSVDGLFETQTNTHFPRYGAYDLAAHPLAEYPASNYGSGVYSRVLEYSVPASLSTIDNMMDNMEEELRLFHFLQAKTLPSGVPVRFMTVLVSESDPLEVDPAQCINYNWSEDAPFLAGYFGTSKTMVDSRTNTTLYYIDADTMQIMHGEPKDPNRLWISEVCRCGPDRFKVTFKLRFCNISNWPTESASIFVEDLTGGNFRCFTANPDDCDLGNDFSINTPNDAGCTPVTTDCAQLIPYVNNRNGNFCLTYDPIKLDDYTIEDGNCHVFSFTAITNENGMDALKAGIPVVKACVTFSETRCELLCSTNAPFELIPIQPCGDPCADCCFQWLCFPNWIPPVLLAVAAVAIAYFMVRRHRNRLNAG